MTGGAFIYIRFIQQSPRSIELHEKVIGAFIEKYMFYSLGAPPTYVPGSYKFKIKITVITKVFNIFSFSYLLQIM